MTPVPPPTVVQVVPENSNAQSEKPNTNQPTNTNSFGFPNVVSGQIKDSRGNMLSGILVEVLDQDNESVRAFRTNTLGQFVSATQLPDGKYTITFEDPKKVHRFSNVNLEVNGTVLPPLNIVSIDDREVLRKSLFG